MNLGDMAAFICSKVNLSEAEDVAACKGYLRQRFEVIWNDDLWKDSLVSYTQAIDPTATYAPSGRYLPTKGVVLVPPLIERVMAVRSDTSRMLVERQEFFYRVDPDIFNETGRATRYHLLPPCVWEFDSAQFVQAMRGNAADVAAVLTADLVDSDAIGVTRQALVLAAAENYLNQTTRIETLTKKASTGTVTLRTVASSTGVLLVNNTASYLYVGTGDDVTLNGPSYEIAAGASLTIPVSGHILANPDHNAIGGSGEAIPGGTAFRGTITAGSLDGFNDAVFTYTSSAVNILTMAAADTNAATRQRIRLVQIPTAALTLRVLGKRTAPTFTSDQDQPGLTGVTNCLIAFGQADMLERERQYGKARAKQEEAGMLLEQLRRMEVVQQAHNARIIPEDGYGDCSAHHHYFGSK